MHSRLSTKRLKYYIHCYVRTGLITLWIYCLCLTESKATGLLNFIKYFKPYVNKEATFLEATTVGKSELGSEKYF